MGFVSTTTLSLLLGLPIIAALIRARERERVDRSKLLGVSVGNNSLLLIISPIILLAILIVAAARPHGGVSEVKLPTYGRDIMVTLDISRSMFASDMSPSRFEVAKRKVLDLISLLRRESPGDRVGIVLFSGESYVLCPLTSDYSALKDYVNSITSQMIALQGSGLNDAIYTALYALKDSNAKFPTILLLTDGEDNRLNISEIKRVISAEGASLGILGFGTLEGAPIELRSGENLRDNSGKVVISKLGEKELQEIASQVGARYLRATIGDSDLEAILGQGSGGVSQREAQSVKVYKEFGPLLLWAVLFSVSLLAFWHKEAWILLLIILVQPSSSFALPPSLYDGYKAYKEGGFKEAEEIFRDAYTEDPSRLDILQSLASAMYKEGKFDEAKKLFDEAVQKSSDGRTKFEALYNRGNSELLGKKYADAIHSYEDALKIKKEDEHTKANLEIARQLLEKEKNQDNKDQKDKNKSNQDNPAPTPTPNEKSNEKGDKGQNSNEKSEENATPTPESQDADKDKGGKPTPNKSDSGKSSDKDKEQKDKEEDKENKEDQGKEAKNEAKLSEQEAKAWLESLPEYSILLRRKNAHSRQTDEQTW